LRTGNTGIAGSVIRLGAVGYLNARPLVYGLDRASEFSLRFDVPSRCAALLHEGRIDVGLIPSIEYLHPPQAGSGAGGYRIVPDLAIASRGPVASVAIYTKTAIADVRSIAMDTSSRTSVALVRVLCARAFHIHPEVHPCPPDLRAMLIGADAALIIGDNALFMEAGVAQLALEKIDLGDAWTKMTGLPFVYAFWAGRPGALTASHVAALQAARDNGVTRASEIAAAYCPGEQAREAIAAGYLRDNIKYGLGPDEREGLDLFFRYAAEAGAVESSGELRFY
jgi:chorismate dehydratase